MALSYKLCWFACPGNSLMSVSISCLYNWDAMTEHLRQWSPIFAVWWPSGGTKGKRAAWAESRLACARTVWLVRVMGWLAAAWFQIGHDLVVGHGPGVRDPDLREHSTLKIDKFYILSKERGLERNSDQTAPFVSEMLLQILSSRSFMNICN